MNRALKVLVLAWVASAVAAEPMVWTGDPLALTLLPEQERRIDFPEPIADVDVPRTLDAHSQIVLTPEGHLHWQAHREFAPERVLATSISGHLYQLDIGADSATGQTTPVVIVDPRLQQRQSEPHQMAAALIPEFLRHDSAARSPTLVDVARFALSHYAGPARLIPERQAVAIAVASVPTAWLRAQPTLRAQPLAQWRIGEYYVTAVGVHNTGAYRVAFDPLALRGDWQFVAALHPDFQPHGSGYERSVWALVSRVPFNQALEEGLWPKP